MNDTTALDPPTTEPADAERRLVRPAEGRVVAGVAAGLARYFGISPVVYRVAFAALVLLGGSGLILYAAAWLVIPDERRDESVVEEAVHHHRDRPWLAIGVGLVGLGLILGITGGSFWSNPGRAWLPALAVGLAILWWQRDRSESAAATVSDPSVPIAPRRRRLPIFPVVVGVLVAAAGVLGVLQATGTANVDWTLALAGGVVLVGVAVAAGAFFGGVGALAALGALLAAFLLAVMTIDVPLHGPVGDRTERPASVLALHDSYRQAIGNLELDLSRVGFPSGRTKVAASVGVGHLRVLVPSDVRVEVNANVSAGEAILFGSHDDGWNVDRVVVAEGLSPGAPTVVLDTDVGLGQLEVRHAIGLGR